MKFDPKTEQEWWSIIHSRHTSESHKRFAHMVLTQHYGVDCDCDNCSPTYAAEIRSQAEEGRSYNPGTLEIYPNAD